MYVEFRPAHPIKCPICWERHKSGFVAHMGDGHRHAIDRKCARLCAQHSDLCPICRTEIDVNSLWPERQRLWRERQRLKASLLRIMAADSFVSSFFSVGLGAGAQVLEERSMSRATVGALSYMVAFRAVFFGSFSTLVEIASAAEPRRPRSISSMAASAVPAIMAAAGTVLSMLSIMHISKDESLSRVPLTLLIGGPMVILAQEILGCGIAHIEYLDGRARLDYD